MQNGVKNIQAVAYNGARMVIILTDIKDVFQIWYHSYYKKKFLRKLFSWFMRQKIDWRYEIHIGVTMRDMSERYDIEVSHLISKPCFLLKMPAKFGIILELILKYIYWGAISIAYKFNRSTELIYQIIPKLGWHFQEVHFLEWMSYNKVSSLFFST